MKTVRRLGAAAALLASVTACNIIEDLTPENISFRMSGADGQVVTAIYSQEFVAGIDESNVTQVQVFGSDTVIHVLPIDTIISIAVERRFFVQVTAAPTDTVVVAVLVEIDGRSLLNTSGGIFPDVPFRYVYQFNELFSDVIEVIF